MKIFNLSVLQLIVIQSSLTFQLFSQVVINEYSASNLNQFPDNYNKYEDWIELYNTGNTAVNIGGYFLSDRPGNPFKWQIPPNTIIPAKGFLLFWTSARNEASGGHYHTNYRMNQTKNNPDWVILSNPFGVILDSYQLEKTQLGHSRGRHPDGTDNWVIFTSPTPKATNNNSTPYLRYADKPQMNVQAGFYNQSLSVSITCDDPGTTIRYTTNGSAPTASSTLYTGPVPVISTTLLQARAFHSNPQILPSFIEFNTYFINFSTTLPVISVSGDQLLQLLNGNASLRPQGTIEYFNTEKIRTSAGYGEFNEHGQDSWVHPQRSFDLIVRDEMGYNYAIRDRLIPITDRDEFQRVIMRAAGDDNYPGKDTSAHMRDIWTQNLAQIWKMNLDVRKGARCVVFANGQYWGIYAIREKVHDHDFTRYYYNQDKYDIQFLMYWGSLWAEYGGQQAISDWMNLRSFILNNNMNDPFAFAYVDSKYDYKSLVDYVIINSFVVCSDWLNWNVGWWRGLNPQGGHRKWGYILWDEDAILGHYINYTGIPGQHPYVPPCFPENLSPSSDPQKHMAIFNKLKTNPIFYQYYISRYIDLINTAFKKEYLLAYLDSTASVIAPEMPRHVSRWGGTVTKWQSNVQKMRNFIINRCDYIKTGLKNCYGLTGPYPITVNVYPAGSGTVILNSLHLQNFPFQGEYFGNIAVLLKAIPANPNLEFDYWQINHHTPDPDPYSPEISLYLNTGDQIVAHFKPKTITDSLVINEINYRSPNWFNTEDWVEFYNPHNYPLNISNWVFKDQDDAHSFVFPAGTNIPAFGYLVLCRDTTAFKVFHPQVTNRLGNMDFGFSSNGELLRLYNDQMMLIDTVHYMPSAPWPPQANGNGPTLELIHPSLNNALPQSWMASAFNGGTPGSMNSLLAHAPENKTSIPDKIHLFPNPASEIVQIVVPESISRSIPMKIEIYSPIGRLINNIQIDENDLYHFQVSGFSTGLYMVVLREISGKIISSSRLMIVK